MTPYLLRNAVTAKLMTAAAAASLVVAGPAWAQPMSPQMATPPQGISAMGPMGAMGAPLASREVDAFMNLHGNVPLWFRGDGSSAAVSTLVQLLRRAPLDGLASGPLLADAVEAAARDAATGAPLAIARADRTLSAAWLAYVAALNAPLPGFTYADPYLTPRTPNAFVTLQRLANAASPASHLMSVAAVNPIYSSLRDASWMTLQRGGGAEPDARMLTNLARARILPSSGKYVVVNAATQELTMVESGRIVDQMKVIVGRPDSPTPMLASTIWYATLNPYWYVPVDLTQKLVAAKMQAPGAKAYWAKKRYEIISDFGPTPTIVPPSAIDWKAVGVGKQTAYLRQLPGPDNSMGVIKFPFPNDTGVYLHDTDLHQLFAVKTRTLSNGCIRLEDAKRLGRWMMGIEPTTASDAPEQHVKLPNGVPVFLTYITAQANGSEMAYVPDVYNRDPVAGSRVATR